MSRRQSRIRHKWLLAGTMLLSPALAGSLLAATESGEAMREKFLATLPTPLGDCWPTARSPSQGFVVRAARHRDDNSAEATLALGDWWPNRD